VDVVVRLMGDVFPELKRNQAKIEEIIAEEESSFSRTLVKVIKYGVTCREYKQLKRPSVTNLL
jgi:alanyl-tRNA synthetase